MNVRSRLWALAMLAISVGLLALGGTGSSSLPPANTFEITASYMKPAVATCSVPATSTTTRLPTWSLRVTNTSISAAPT